MKVFWAWQSDTPGKTGRHFVREALEAAIEQIKSEVALDEPEARDLHLDHDRKGVAGSPDLARTILEKIKGSAIFVGDVTLVGSSDFLPEGSEPKRFINANVAIELGYALRSLGDERVLMVMNEHYGGREGLPFDLRHKAGPIMYQLAPDAPAATHNAEKARLVGVLKRAITDALPPIQSAAFEEVPSKQTKAEYFEVDEQLVPNLIHPKEGDAQTVPFVYYEAPLLYLRLIPTVPGLTFSNAELKKLVRDDTVRPLGVEFNGNQAGAANQYGGIAYSCWPFPGGQVAFVSTQIFNSGEIWGIDGRFFSIAPGGVPAAPVERIWRRGLQHYVSIATNHLGLKFPFVVKAGIVRLGGRSLFPEHTTPLTGPPFVEDVEYEGRLDSEEEVDAVLLRLFEQFWDAAGQVRPQGYNNFPPPQ